MLFLTPFLGFAVWRWLSLGTAADMAGNGAAGFVLVMLAY